MHDPEDALRGELEEWSRAGRTARFWWRDDDAVGDCPALRRLLEIAGSTGIEVALAVVPEHAAPSLVNMVRDSRCCVWQHGYRHHWEHETAEQRYLQGEFGEGRALRAMLDDARSGQDLLDRRFGPGGWQRVFVPPFHALSMPFKSLLPSLGYLGVSAGRPFTPAIASVPQVDAEIDIMNWPARRFVGAEAAVAMIVEQLANRRSGRAAIDAPIGLLTHHEVLDEDAWAFLTTAFSFLKSSGAEFLPASSLFRNARASAEGGAARRAPAGAAVTGVGSTKPLAGDVTVVLTSCGRQDLLETTLDSFLRFNTHPVREIIVVEDGDGARNNRLMEKYRADPFRWMSSGERVGQIAAIDLGYRAARTEFIFHCEDDWEFTAPGFIEKSLAVLRDNDAVLQVWLRALDDTNNHPLLPCLLMAANVPYRLLRHNHSAGQWGTWHGFSWNPGLRRRREYELLGTFQSLDPEGTKSTWQIESEASAFYQRMGLFAAILADDDGNGYVRHIGGDRRVPRIHPAPR